MAPRTIVVIGAGIIGCLVASELAARDPKASVTVLDRDAIGAGASRRSAGLHLPRGSTPRIRQMAAYSHAYYASMRRQDPELPIHPVGATVITRKATAATLGDRYLDLAAPAPASRLPGRDLCQRDGQVAWQIAGSHYTDVGKLCEAVAAGLRSSVPFPQGVAVTRIAVTAPARTDPDGSEADFCDAAVTVPGGAGGQSVGG